MTHPKMKKMLLAAALLLTATATWAVKANTTPAVILQKDGSQITVYAHGGSANHYYTLADGTLLFHEGTDFYVAEVTSDGTLRATTQLAHEPAHRSLKERQLVARQDREHYFTQQHRKAMRAKEMAQIPTDDDGTYFPHTGSPRAVVILVDFSDCRFVNSDADTKDVFNTYFNATSEEWADGKANKTPADTTVYDNYGSVRMYFEEMSYGAFKPQFDVYGPYHLSNNLKYYGAGDDDDMSRLIPDACKAADADIDFSQYDANGDGKVDLVYIITSGYSQSWTQNSTDCIWPKSGPRPYSNGTYYTSGFGTYDGKTVFRYGVHTELNGYPGAFSKEPFNHINGIGLFCHEFSHCMGMPDLYPTVTSARKDDQAMEDWDIMDGGEYNMNGWYPAEYTAWERESMGWMEIESLTEPGTYRMRSINLPDGKAYRIVNDNDATGNEYFILQNIRRTRWNQGMKASGMMVTHVAYDKNAFSMAAGSPNNEAGKPRMHLVAADGILKTSYIHEDYKTDEAGDLFPGPQNNRFLTDTSAIIKPRVYTAKPLGKPIYNIHEDGAWIEFDFLEDSHATAIAAIRDSAEATDRRIFTTDGRFAGTDRNKLEKGIYIINKKKVIIR